MHNNTLHWTFRRFLSIKNPGEDFLQSNFADMRKDVERSWITPLHEFSLTARIAVLEIEVVTPKRKHMSGNYFNTVACKNYNMQKNNLGNGFTMFPPHNTTA